MYHPPPKRKQLVQRIAVYALMSVTVAGLVIVLVLIMLGYQFNRNDGKIEQGGLVQFDTRPGGANVTIDGNNFGTRTPSKTTATAGQHLVTMQRDGYRPWQKSVEVVPGSVLWLNYARLIPEKLTPADVASFPTLAGTLKSPDSKWMAMQETTDSATVKLVNLTSDTIKTADLVLPTDSYTAPSEGQTQSFRIVSWDNDSRYLIINHTYDGTKQEWLTLDTTDATNTKNLTKLFGIDATKVIFSDDDSQVLYAQIGTDVRKLEISGTKLSSVLLQNIAEFSSYDHIIGYVTLPDPVMHQRSVGYINDGVDKARTLKSFNDDGTAPLHLAIGKYFGDYYVSIAHGEQLEILMGDLPRSDAMHVSALKNVVSLSIPGGASYLSDKTEGRFIVAQHGTTYTVYDLELKKMTTTNLKESTPVDTELRWIDGYTLWSDQNNQLRFYEFDGANQQNIMQVESGFDIAISQNNKYLYGVTKSPDGQFHLTRVQLTTS